MKKCETEIREALELVFAIGILFWMPLTVGFFLFLLIHYAVSD
jgi:hypothetical protein